MADIFLVRDQEFEHHAAHILQFDRYLGLLAESCLLSPRLATTVREFEVGSQVFRDPDVRILWGPDRGTWKDLREVNETYRRTNLGSRSGDLVGNRRGTRD